MFSLSYEAKNSVIATKFFYFWWSSARVFFDEEVSYFNTKIRGEKLKKYNWLGAWNASNLLSFIRRIVKRNHIFG